VDFFFLLFFTRRRYPRWVYTSEKVAAVGLLAFFGYGGYVYEYR
jgi:hypothetical protein